MLAGGLPNLGKSTLGFAKKLLSPVAQAGNDAVVGVAKDIFIGNKQPRVMLDHVGSCMQLGGRLRVNLRKISMLGSGGGTDIASIVGSSGSESDSGLSAKNSIDYKARKRALDQKHEETKALLAAITKVFKEAGPDKLVDDEKSSDSRDTIEGVIRSNELVRTKEIEEYVTVPIRFSFSDLQIALHNWKLELLSQANQQSIVEFFGESEKPKGDKRQTAVGAAGAASTKSTEKSLSDDVPKPFRDLLVSIRKYIQVAFEKDIQKKKDHERDLEKARAEVKKLEEVNE